MGIFLPQNLLKKPTLSFRLDMDRNNAQTLNYRQKDLVFGPG